MSPTEAEISAVMDLAAASGVIVVPDRIKNLHRRVNSQATAVAVIGMVKRGKSTLLNRLVGVDVSAVAATPETASTIRVMTGPPTAWMSSNAGGPEEDLSADPSKFLEQSRRPPDKNRKRAAGISGAFRLPEGLVLVDTPGVGDVAAELDDLYADIDEQWIEAGCGAAIVVINTGAGSYDLELFRRARSTFPGAVEVVMKSTDDSVSFDDVCEYAEYIESQPEWNCTVLAVSDVIPDKAWGSSRDFGPLENLISELGERAAARIGVDIQFYERFVDQFVSELNEILPVDRSGIEAVLGNLPPHLPVRLQSALAGCKRKFELEDLDAQTRVLVSEIHERESHGADPTKKQFDQLLKISEKGSEAAQKEVVRVMSTWGIGQRPFALALQSLGSEHALRLVESITATNAQLVNALEDRRIPRKLKVDIETKLVRQVLAKPSVESIRIVIGAVAGEGSREQLHLALGTLLTSDLQRDLATEGDSQLSRLASSYQRARGWLDETSGMKIRGKISSDYERVRSTIAGSRPQVVSTVTQASVSYGAKTSQTLLVGRLNSLDKFFADFALSDSEVAAIQFKIVDYLYLSQPELSASEQTVEVFLNWVRDQRSRDILLLQVGKIRLRKFRQSTQLDDLETCLMESRKASSALFNWERDTESIGPESEQRRRGLLSEMSSTALSYAKNTSVKISDLFSSLFLEIPSTYEEWNQKSSKALEFSGIYLSTIRVDSEDPIRKMHDALQSERDSWFAESRSRTSESFETERNKKTLYIFGLIVSLIGGLIALAMSVERSSSDTMAGVGMLLIFSGAAIVCAVEASISVEDRVAVSPPPPPAPIPQPRLPRIQSKKSASQINGHWILGALFALIGALFVLGGLARFGNDSSNSKSTTKSSTSTTRETNSTSGRSPSESSSTSQTSTTTATTATTATTQIGSGAQSSSGLPNTTVTTSRANSSGSASTSSTSRPSLPVPTTTTPATVIPTASNQVASATNTGWGRYSVMTATQVTVPQGADHLFSISGGSTARYSSGSGTVQVSLTIQVDGYFREHPGNGPTYFLTSAGQEVSNSYSYTIQLGPGTHLLQLLAYPHVPSPTVSFRAQSIRVADLGVVR
jgi:hypothetical protein